MRLLPLLVLGLSGCATTAASLAPVDAAELSALSKQYMAAVDALDAAAVDGLTAQQFNRTGRNRFVDRKTFLDGMAARAKTGFPKVLSRTWAAERLRVEGQTAAFTAFTETEQVVNAEGRKSTSPVSLTLIWVRAAGAWRLLHHQQEDNGLEAQRSTWNEVFRQATGFNLKPNRFLMEVTQTLPRGKALDVGVGQGRNAIALASQGWAVTGIDIADEGVRQTLATAKENGLTVDAQVQDARKWDWGTAQWDLICLIYEHGAEYVEQVTRALKPGGVLVLEYFHVDATKGSGAGGFKSDEVPALFKALKTVRYEEVMDTADYGAPHPVKLIRYVGRKP